MQRVIRLKPGEARCVPHTACSQRDRCAPGAAPAEPGRPVAVYSTEQTWKNGQCPKFIAAEKRRDAPKEDRQARECPEWLR